jgi:hypothetical protein
MAVDIGNLTLPNRLYINKIQAAGYAITASITSKTEKTIVRNIVMIPLLCHYIAVIGQVLNERLLKTMLFGSDIIVQLLHNFLVSRIKHASP